MIRPRSNATFQRVANRSIIAGACAFAACASVAMAESDWTQWGGPHRDFTCKDEGLAAKWPDSGPKQMWSRDLGEGYTAVVVENGRLYTMGHSEKKEAVMCLNAADGKTIWEHAYDVKIPSGHERQFGVGPRGTPLLEGDRLYTCGVAGNLFCLDKNTGKPVWSHDLMAEFNATLLNHGYSSSPLSHKDAIILPVGGKGHGLMAFAKKDGTVRWSAQDFDNSYCSARILKLAGADMLVCGMAKEIVAVDPDGGALLWSFPYENQWKQNVMMPIACDDELLFISAADIGSRGLKITKDGAGFKAEEAWKEKKVRVYHGGAIRLGDYIYGSSGEMGPYFFFGMDAKSGKIAWRARGVAKATFVYADGKFIILDEDGNLFLASATPEGLNILSQSQILTKPAWTSPTLVGKTLYVRDLKKLMAFNVG